jgi:hypothetical protein
MLPAGSMVDKRAPHPGGQERVRISEENSISFSNRHGFWRFQPSEGVQASAIGLRVTFRLSFPDRYKSLSLHARRQRVVDSCFSFEKK